MKFCRRPFEYIFIAPDFNVNLCVWATGKEREIGNLLTQTLPEMWNSEKAKHFRESVSDGSFKYCRKYACPFLQRNELPEIQNESDLIPLDTPADIRVACDKTCNLSCPSCRNEIFVPTEQYKQNLEICYEKIKPYLKYAHYFNFGGQGEVLASPFYMKILENFNPDDPSNTEIVIETNGVLFDEAHWNRISHLADCKLLVTVSVDSLYEPTYNYLRKGGNLEKVKKNLKFLSELHKAGKIKWIFIVLVVQDVNFREIPDFINYGVYELGVSRINLMPIYNWGNLTEAEILVKDVLNPAHPYHQEFLKIKEHPLMKLPQVRLWSGDSVHDKKEIISPVLKTSDIYFNLLLKMFQLRTMKKTVSGLLKKKDINNICVYGVGVVAQALADELSSDGISIEFMIDRSITCYKEYKILRIEQVCDFDNIDAVLITSPRFFDEMSAEIRNKPNGDKTKILDLQCLIDELACGD